MTIKIHNYEENFLEYEIEGIRYVINSDDWWRECLPDEIEDFEDTAGLFSPHSTRQVMREADFYDDIDDRHAEYFIRKNHKQMGQVDNEHYQRPL